MIHSIKHFSIYAFLAGLIAVIAIGSGFDFFNWGYITLLLVFASFLLSSIIVYGPKNQEAYKQTQRFILATSIQFLVTLFHVLLLIWKARAIFRSEALFLVGVFFAFLMVQLTLFIRNIQKSED